MTAPPPSRTSERTVTRPDPARSALRYALLVTAGLVLLLVMIAGCGAAPLPPAAPSTIAPTTPLPSPPPAPTTAAPTTTPAPTDPTTPKRERERAPAQAPHAATPRTAPTPIWPATDAASARGLQDQVDGGRQPWLLDPTEVAVSYAGAVLGYRNPGVFPLETGRIDVQDGRSPAKATITLGQTVRRGDGGIWLVTGVQRR